MYEATHLYTSQKNIYNCKMQGQNMGEKQIMCLAKSILSMKNPMCCRKDWQTNWFFRQLYIDTASTKTISCIIWESMFMVIKWFSSRYVLSVLHLTLWNPWLFSCTFHKFSCNKTQFFHFQFIYLNRYLIYNVYIMSSFY